MEGALDDINVSVRAVAADGVVELRISRERDELCTVARLEDWQAQQVAAALQHYADKIIEALRAEHANAERQLTERLAEIERWRGEE